MTSGKPQELQRLIREARAKGELYFTELNNNAEDYDFDRVEAARKSAIQAIREVQHFADLNKLSGAGFSAAVRSGVDVDLERIRKNIETVQRLKRG